MSAASFTMILVIVLLLLLAINRMLRSLREQVDQTTLFPAMVAAELCLFVTVPLAATDLLRGVPFAADSQLISSAGRFLIGVLLLVPPMLALGARRPQNRAWPWFVILPMIIVLAWPAIVHITTGQMFASLKIETPQAVGFAIVLVMGAGNYFGTRFTVASILYAGGVVLFAFEWETLMTPDAAPTMLPGVGLLLLASVAAARRQHVSHDDDKVRCLTRYRSLWTDVRDFFGTVWAKRLMDRLNQVAASEQWPVRLDLSGLHFLSETENMELTEEQHARIEHHFRWLLRRFVEPEWIDERLAPTAETKSADETETVPDDDSGTPPST